jgi:hypothetical protein
MEWGEMGRRVWALFLGLRLRLLLFLTKSRAHTPREAHWTRAVTTHTAKSRKKEEKKRKKGK